MTDFAPPWQGYLNPHLLRRLMRPLLRPGRIRLQMAHTLLQRLSFGRGTPLQAQVERTWNPHENPRATPVPIVYAEPPLLPEPAFVEVSEKPEKTVVQVQAITHTPPPQTVWANAAPPPAPVVRATPPAPMVPATPPSVMPPRSPTPKPGLPVLQRKTLANAAQSPVPAPKAQAPSSALPEAATINPTAAAISAAQAASAEPIVTFTVQAESSPTAAEALAMPLVQPFATPPPAQAAPASSNTTVLPTPSARTVSAMPLVQPIAVTALPVFSSTAPTDTLQPIARPQAAPDLPFATPTTSPRLVVQPLATIKDTPPLVEILWGTEQLGAAPNVVTQSDFAGPQAVPPTMPLVRPLKPNAQAAQAAPAVLPVVRATAPAAALASEAAPPSTTLPLNRATPAEAPHAAALLQSLQSPPSAAALPGPLVAPRANTGALTTQNTTTPAASPTRLPTLGTPPPTPLAAKTPPSPALDLNALAEKVQRKLKRDLARELEIARERRGRFPR